MISDNIFTQVFLTLTFDKVVSLFQGRTPESEKKQPESAVFSEAASIDAEKHRSFRFSRLFNTGLFQRRRKIVAG